MITIGSGALAALTSRSVAEAWLVELWFSVAPPGMVGPVLPGGYPVRITTWPTDVTTAGADWRGLGPQLGISQVQSTEDAGPGQVTLSLPLVPGMLAAVLGNVETYRGRRARIMYQVIDADTLQPIDDPIPVYVGEMQPVSVQRDSPGAGGGAVRGRIEMRLTRAGTTNTRREDGLRMTHQQQQARYPGDRGLEYVASLVRGDAVWVSAAFLRSL